MARRDHVLGQIFGHDCTGPDDGAQSSAISPKLMKVRAPMEIWEP